MRTLIINFKNYQEILGQGSIALAEAAQSVSEKSQAEIVVAPPSPMLALVASRVSIPVFSQTVGSEVGEKTTGALLPEAVKGARARGTILNHSESRTSQVEIRRLLPRFHALSLDVCICAATSAEAARLGRLGTKYLAVEPPGLIGSGVAVSKARPDLVSKTVTAARGAGYRGRILCGAGIVNAQDVRKAVELGADGVLVSSSVVKARDWRAKIEELAHSLQ